MDDKPLIFAILIYIYFHITCCKCWNTKKKNKSITPQPQYNEIKEEFGQLKELILNIYKNSSINLNPPSNKEERCLPMNGHIGTIINRAIEFCG